MIRFKFVGFISMSNDDTTVCVDFQQSRISRLAIGHIDHLFSVPLSHTHTHTHAHMHVTFPPHTGLLSLSHTHTNTSLSLAHKHTRMLISRFLYSQMRNLQKVKRNLRIHSLQGEGQVLELAQDLCQIHSTSQQCQGCLMYVLCFYLLDSKLVSI